MANTVAEEREASNAVDVLKERGFSQVTLRKVATWLNRGVYGVGIAIYFLPDPHNVLVWVDLAWPWLAVAMVAMFQPFYRFGGLSNSPLPDLSRSLFLPGFFLVLTALTMSTVGWHRALGLTVVGGFILTGAAIYVDPWLRRHLVTAAQLALLCCAYGYGAGLEVNALLDHSPPTSYPASVLSKRSIRGSRSTTYYLSVPAWGPYQAGQEVMVSPWRYRTTQVGDTICILLRPGALRVSWYTVASCAR